MPYLTSGATFREARRQTNRSLTTAEETMVFFVWSLKRRIDWIGKNADQTFKAGLLAEEERNPFPRAPARMWDCLLDGFIFSLTYFFFFFKPKR